MKNFPFKYYFYGSQDSQDLDVLIQIPRELMPEKQEERKIYLKSLEEEYNLPWNANLIVVEEGVVVDTIYPKSWIDGVNNSFFSTYELHLDKQIYPLPIERKVERNKLLAIYKTIRTIMAMLSRTEYRTVVKPVLKGVHPFKLKIEALKKIDFSSIENFNQPNVEDVDIWKIIAFYLGQNISLIRDGVEIYTKRDLCAYHPQLTPFVYRKELGTTLKSYINQVMQYYLNCIVIPYGDYICNGSTLECNGEKIDMKNEIYL